VSNAAGPGQGEQQKEKTTARAGQHALRKARWRCACDRRVGLHRDVGPPSAVNLPTAGPTPGWQARGGLLAGCWHVPGNVLMPMCWECSCFASSCSAPFGPAFKV